MSKTHIRKFKWAYILLFFVLAIGYVIFRFFNPSVGFTYYEPSYVPANISVKTKRISITRGNVQVEQDFRTEDWVYSISEYKSDESIGDAKQNYDPKSITPTCEIRISPVKTQYRLCHWIDYGKIDVHEIKFIKNGTFIDAQIPTELKDQITVDQLDTFVDSFKKKSTIGLPVLRSNGA